jgi:uncharacterized membrane protein
MSKLKKYSLYFMAVGYTLAGINHFAQPALYMPIMPPWLPAPELMNYLAGLTEVILGIGLIIPRTRYWAAWGVIALLLAVFPANIYMYQTNGAGYNFSQTGLLLRLPMQFVLMLWVFWYTRKPVR